MATIPDVGSITVIALAEMLDIFAGAIVYSRPPNHAFTPANPAQVSTVEPLPSPESGRITYQRGFAESLPIYPGRPYQFAGESAPPDGGSVSYRHGTKEPDGPQAPAHFVREFARAEPFAGSVTYRHGTKEPDTPAAITRWLVQAEEPTPDAGRIIIARGFQEAVVHPGRPVLVRAEEPPPYAGWTARNWIWADGARPWGGRLVRAEEPPPFAGSISQSRIPELAPASPRPGLVVRSEEPRPVDGLAITWRQIIVQPGVSPTPRPQIVRVFDPHPDAGLLMRARGFAAATVAPDPTPAATAPYRLAAGQIFTPGAIAGQTGGQG